MKNYENMANLVRTENLKKEYAETYNRKLKTIRGGAFILVIGFKILITLIFILCTQQNY